MSAPRWVHSDASARLAVSRDWWDWMPGMEAMYFEPGRMVYERVFADYGAIDTLTDTLVWHSVCRVPNLADPATLGCIGLVLLPERHGDGAEVYYDYGAWWLRRTGHAHTRLDVTDPRARGEALVAALEVEP